MADTQPVFAGLASGIDWSSLIASMKTKSEAAVNNTTGKQLVLLQGRKVTVQNIQSQLLNFKNIVSSINSPTGLIKKTATSDNENIVKAMATSAAQAGTVTVHVNKLAKQEIWMADFADGNATPVTSADADITIDVRGQQNTIKITGGSTLQQMANTINDAKLGITATVFDSGVEGVGGGTYRMTITDNSLGKASGLTHNLTINTSNLSNDPNFGSEPSVDAQNSEALINGVTIERSSNMISDIAPGVIIDLKGVDSDLPDIPSNTHSITIAESSGDIAKKFNDFVAAYNTLITLINQEFKLPEPGQDLTNSSTAGRSGIRTLQTMLRNSIDDRVIGLPDSEIRTLADIGITADKTAKNGTLSIDSAKMNAATAQGKLDELQKFLFGDTENKITGFITQLNTKLTSLSTGDNGVLTSVLNSFNTQALRLNDRYQQQLDRIDVVAKRMSAQFSNLESILSGFYQQQNYLDQYFGTTYAKK